MTTRLLLIVLSAFCLIHAEAAELTEHQQLARDIFKELIEINTTDSQGDNTAAARAVKRACWLRVFRLEDIAGIVPQERKGNIVARLRAPAATPAGAAAGASGCRGSKSLGLDGAPVQSFSSVMATSTVAAPRMTKPRRPSGWPT